MFIILLLLSISIGFVFFSLVLVDSCSVLCLGTFLLLAFLAVFLISTLLLVLLRSGILCQLDLLFDKYLNVNFVEARSGLQRPTYFIDGSEKVFASRLDLVSRAKGVLLGPSTTSTRVEGDQWLPVRTLGMLIFHVRVEGWVREVRLLTESAPIVSPMHVVLASSLLFFLNDAVSAYDAGALMVGAII